MATTPATFGPIWTSYNATLVQGVTNQVSNGLQAVSGDVLIALSLYVIIAGFLVIYGRMTWEEGMRRLIRALLVVAILSPAMYNQYIVTGFTQTIPQFISTAMGGNTASNDITTTQAFDQLLAGTEAVKDYALLVGGSNPYYIPQELWACIAAGCAEFLLAVGFIIWFLSRVLVSILVCVGPFLMLFYLFNTTRHIPERFISKLIGGMILILMVLIVTGIIQAQEQANMQTVAAVIRQTATATPSPAISSYTQMTLPSNAQSVDQIVDLIWHIALDFGIGAFIMLMLPGVAAYIGGGVAFSVQPLISTLTNRLWRPRR